MKKLYILILLFIFIFVDVKANDDLLKLAVNDKLVTCTGYECQLEIDAEVAKITYELGENVKSATPNSGHSVSLDNNYTLQIGVTYQDETEANYTLTIIKHQKSTDNTLKTLLINEEEVKLTDDVFVYSYETKFNDEVIKVVGKAKDDNAKCEDKEYEFDLEKSSLSIIYPVTAENGEVRNYTIILKRKNKPDTTLKTLSLSDIEFNFDKSILDYDIIVPYSINTTEIKAIANSKEASVTIEMDEFFIVGENIIKVIVTNQEACDTYAIRVNRLENLDETLANLKSLEIEGYKINFKPDVLEYDLIYSEIPGKLNIEAKCKDETGVVTILGNENLVNGSVVSVKITLENGLVRTYKLNIIEEQVQSTNRVLIIILIVVLVIIMIILLIFQIRDNKKNKIKKVKKKKVTKKKEEEEIEVI